jgi:mevalonate kinase
MHEKWMAQKLARGVTSHKIETGEEVMVDYDKLSEAAKDLDRGMADDFFEVLFNGTGKPRTATSCRKEVRHLAQEFEKTMNEMLDQVTLTVTQRLSEWLMETGADR